MNYKILLCHSWLVLNFKNYCEGTVCEGMFHFCVQCVLQYRIVTVRIWIVNCKQFIFSLWNVIKVRRMWSWWRFPFWMESRWIHFGPWLLLWSYLFLFDENRRLISLNKYTLKAEFLFHFELKVWVWLRSQAFFFFVTQRLRTVPKQGLWTQLHCFWFRWNFILYLCVCTSCSVWLLVSEILFHFFL